jgi:hypothetical protein
MSDPKSSTSPRPFDPMMHAYDYAGYGGQGWSAQAIAQGWSTQGTTRAWSAQSAYEWEATWGRNSSQTMAPRIPPFDQTATPMPLRQYTLAVMPATESVVAEPRTFTVTLQSTISVKAALTAEVTRTAPRIARAPAARLVSVLSFVLTRSAYERIIVPYIAQEQHEHYEALLRKEFRRASFIVARMYLLTILICMRALVAPLAKLFTRSD